jgi:hypothetical protein
MRRLGSLAFRGVRVGSWVYFCIKKSTISNQRVRYNQVINQDSQTAKVAFGNGDVADSAGDANATQTLPHMSPKLGWPRRTKAHEPGDGTATHRLGGAPTAD